MQTFPFAVAEEIRILAWNLESDRDSTQTNDPETIANWLTSFDGYDIFALSEVKRENARRYIRAIARGEGAFFRYKVGAHNANDHLMIAWDSERFQQRGLVTELSHLRFGDGGRAPLLVRLTEQSSGAKFTVVANHLHRSSKRKRRRQTAGLREWVKDQSEPVFLVGDFNSDISVRTGSGNRSFRYLLQGGHCNWVEPEVKMRTEDSQDSILDLVVVNRAAAAWNPKSTIIKRNGEFRPVKKKSDHRPITASFSPSSDHPTESLAGVGGRGIDARYLRLEERMDRLESRQDEDRDDGYYSNIAEDLSGEDLKRELHDLIKGHRTCEYGELWDALSYTDQDLDDGSKVVLFYTGWRYSNQNHGGGVSQWNREHVWPKSKGDFGTHRGAGTDMHHIRPTDVTVNSKRGSLSFDSGGELYNDPDGPTTNRFDDDSWEPRDQVKGDVARMIMYMTVRYEGSRLDLEVVDRIVSDQSREPRIGKLSKLLEWHQLDPPSEFEKRRNQRVFEWQGNRNPFIDHPGWAEKLWGGTS